MRPERGGGGRGGGGGGAYIKEEADSHCPGLLQIGFYLSCRPEQHPLIALRPLFPLPLAVTASLDRMQHALLLARKCSNCMQLCPPTCIQNEGTKEECVSSPLG